MTESERLLDKHKNIKDYIRGLVFTLVVIFLVFWAIGGFTKRADPSKQEEWELTTHHRISESYWDTDKYDFYFPSSEACNKAGEDWARIYWNPYEPKAPKVTRFTCWPAPKGILDYLKLFAPRLD